MNYKIGAVTVGRLPAGRAGREQFYHGCNLSHRVCPESAGLKFNSLGRAGAGNHIPDVCHSGNILNKPFETKTKTGMRC
jgi:hypothetical protein